jgi:adenylylsulfate kinase
MTLQDGFALWLTGRPASGKSSITRELAELLRARGLIVIVLESDAMRRILTPEPVYTDEERNRFYRQLTLLGEMITKNEGNVIFDATGNKRAYRDYARTRITRYLEVYVDCPLAICRERDPKGIYANAALNKAATVPGLQAPYEPPFAPEIVLDGQAPPRKSAETILDKLKQFLYI